MAGRVFGVTTENRQPIVPEAPAPQAQPQKGVGRVFGGGQVMPHETTTPQPDKPQIPSMGEAMMGEVGRAAKPVLETLKEAATPPEGGYIPRGVEMMATLPFEFAGEKIIHNQRRDE